MVQHSGYVVSSFFFVDVYYCDAKSTFNVRQSTIQKWVGRSDEAKLDVLAVFQGVCGLVRLPYKAASETQIALIQ